MGLSMHRTCHSNNILENQSLTLSPHPLAKRNVIIADSNIRYQFLMSSKSLYRRFFARLHYFY